MIPKIFPFLIFFGVLISDSGFAQRSKTIDFFFTDDQILEEELIDITEGIYAPISIKLDYQYEENQVPSNFRKTLEKNLEWSGYFQISDGNSSVPLTLLIEDTVFKGVQVVLYSGNHIIYEKLLQFVKTPTENELEIIHLIDQMTEKLSDEKTSLSKAILFVESGLNRSKRIVISDANGLRKKILIDDGNLNLFPKFSPSGDSFIYTNLSFQGSKIIYYNFHTKKQKTLAFYKGLSSGGDWVDNKSFVTSISTRTNADLYRLDLNGKILQKLTTHRSIETSPSIYKQNMLFVSDRSGSIQIYRMNLQTKKTQRLTFFSNYSSEPKYSHDGNHILFSANSGGSVFQIFMMSNSGGSMRRITKGLAGAEQPSWSPDDRLIIYSQKKPGGKDLYIMTLEGKYRRKLSGTFSGAQISQPDWSGSFDWKLIFR